ncbi:MAG: hypothetical protein CMQ08_06330 [Gammaproteobacteria bacterium]|nr:hypothetical protein [Gammaproteobacteria bacterium]MAX07575.1 hypothetical protein [Gammaproteobacteria bacterium]
MIFLPAMLFNFRKARLVAIALFLLLAACEAQESIPVPVAPAESTVVIPEIRPLSEPRVVIASQQTARERFIADTLYEALQALDDDRLLKPADDSAHGRFKRILAMDPENEIATDGLERIVLRYVELSLEASRRGLFVDAGELLENAKFVDEDHPALLQAWLSLQSEQNSGDLFFNLDNQEFSARSESAQAQLADIANQAKQHEAFFLITAPNDALARWMFLEMRSAVEGYRLRGNIELASQISIRLRISED